MTTAEYWRDRAEMVMEKGMSKADVVLRDLQKMYAQAARDVQAEIDKLYRMYAQESGLSYADAQAYLNRAERTEWRMTLAEYVDRINATGDKALLAELNALAQATGTLSTDNIKKLGAAVTLAKPQNAEQAKNLVENLDLFDFAPDAHSPAEYGKYMIQQSGHYEFDENLDEFYDYEGYAQQRLNDEDGMFTDRGYIAYKGYFSLEEIMEGGQGGSMEMGGMV